MTRVILTLALITSAAVFGAAQLFQLMPSATGTAVIAEKTTSTQIGGQAAITLPANLTSTQGKLLTKAYEIAKADGHKNPELLQALLLQETQAGGMKSYRVANPGADAYFGPMQIKLAAARDVLQRWPVLFTKYGFHTCTDDEIKANLILNESFNLEVASKYLIVLQKTYGFSGRELMNAYNRGPGGVKAVDDDYHYALGAEAKLVAYKAKR